ncbi:MULTISPECIES: 2-isopropylmalate synthase [Clostridium]|jgi:isopropylmalate/homocitrate/citramalate synthase|uniref:2-isopropylmalate synthase n=1 Tax=Clostridium TaxID=1485 RepID=UPI000287CA57|nr:MULTISPECIES: 2-isopropylmalate synthase [Clostridium]MDF2502988.1 isopropylmalate/homocitrate/citramalate synthase [Clostridium sp.]
MKSFESSFDKNEHSIGSHISDVKEPNLYRDLFPYSEIPKVKFDGELVPMDLPEDIWITDTTFRDGQQSMTPFKVEQIVRIFNYLHELDNNSGIIRQTEFFTYTNRDIKALEECMSLGYKFPEITTWIRANKDELRKVKELGVKETGMLMSCSDYHIFKKLKLNRNEAFNKYIDVVETALEYGIVPRIHLEDITRADFFGFVVPFVNKLMELSKESKIQIKIRACDTLGMGVSYASTALPRSIQKIINGLRVYCNVPQSALEWHGHNDFYNVVSGSSTAWLYGCSSVNTTLLGIGERTGNCPLEAMVMEYGQIKGNTKKMNLHKITEIADYFSKNMGYKIPIRTPFVGSDFNVTRAGIHADGMLKDEEIYNIFDTDKILDRPIVVAVNEYSGLAGITAWINTYFKLSNEDKISKRDERVAKLRDWVDSQYENGRTSAISNKELELVVKRSFSELMYVEGSCVGYNK